MSKSIGVFLVFVSWILSKEMYLSSLVEGNARCTSNKKIDFRPSEKKTQKITVPVTTPLSTTSLRVLPPRLSRQLLISIIIQGSVPILWTIRSRLYVNGALDLLVWLCWMNYWWDPYYKSWRRTIDISASLVARRMSSRSPTCPKKPDDLALLYRSWISGRVLLESADDSKTKSSDLGYLAYADAFLRISFGNCGLC